MRLEVYGIRREYAKIGLGRIQALPQAPEEPLVTVGIVPGIEQSLGEHIILEDGLPSFELLTISGFVEFSNVASILGSSLAYMPLDTLQELVEMDKDLVNEVIVSNSPLLKYRLGKDYRLVPGARTISFQAF